MRRRYAKYELGRWIGFLIACFGAIMIAGMESIIDTKSMLGQAIVFTVVTLFGVTIYQYCKYKELYLREKRKRAQELELQIGA